MKIFKVGALILAVAAIVALFAAPIGPMPGIFIGGTPTALPAVWQDTSGIHEIQLAVGEGAIAHVVIIWVIQVGGELHVVGSKESSWTSTIGSAAPVRVRVGDQTYEMNATLITEDWEPILEAYVGKYRPDYPEIVGSFPAIEDARESISVFRLSAPETA